MFKSLKSRFKSTQKKRKSTSLSPRTKSVAATTLQTTFRNKEDCAICFSKMLNIKTQVRLVNCGHTFHRDCINKFVTSGGTTCPNCRRPFTDADIVTPNQYRILEATKRNQPHTLKKTLRLYDKTVADCKEAYEKHQDASVARYKAQKEHFFYWIKKPHPMNPARYFYNKKVARLEKIYNEADSLTTKTYYNFKSKCKAVPPFTSQSQENSNPNEYKEFNEYIQSIYHLQI